MNQVAPTCPERLSGRIWADGKKQSRLNHLAVKKKSSKDFRTTTAATGWLRRAPLRPPETCLAGQDAVEDFTHIAAELVLVLECLQGLQSRIPPRRFQRR